jgi:hypothetical protein
MRRGHNVNVRAVLITLGLFAVFGAIAMARQSRAARRIAKSRRGQGFLEFAASFEGSDVPEQIQRKVFEYAQNNWYAYPVRAEDALYPLDEEDLEDAILELARACGKEAPLLNVWKGRPIATAGDIARLIAHLPTSEEVRVEGSRRLWTDQ